MKKILSVLLATTFCINTILPVFANGSYTSFSANRTYTNQFVDIKDSDWFAPYVKQCFETDIMSGKSDNKFEPNSYLTLAETITLSANIHSLFTTGKKVAPGAGASWYTPYVDYALKNNIISKSYSNYNIYASRKDVAKIFVKSLPDGNLSKVREIPDGSIPDVPMSMDGANEIYTLYRAGVLSGNDKYGRFFPDNNIKRSEIAIICVSISNPNVRNTSEVKWEPLKDTSNEVVSQPQSQTYNQIYNQTQTNGKVLSAQEIAERYSDSVFYIETYSFNGSLRCSGSGFFISEDGLAITNHHVVENSEKIKISTPYGYSTFDVRIIDADSENDLALLKISGNNFKPFKLDYSVTLKQGQTAYAIGSPVGLDNTISQGIISNPNRVIDGRELIQFSVPITHGSSGGALIDGYGNLVGVTTSGFGEGDVNLAVPIRFIKNLDSSSKGPNFIYGSYYYPGFSHVLDFGKFSGVRLIYAEEIPLGYNLVYEGFDFYNIDDMEEGECYAYTMYNYASALQSEGLIWTDKFTDAELGIFQNETEHVRVHADLKGSKTINITVEKRPQGYSDFGYLPDFGWYSSMQLSSQPGYFDDGAIVYPYKWSDYYDYNTFMETLFRYFNLLELIGYKYVYGDDGKIYMFEGYGLSVVVSIISTTVVVDVKPV